MAAVYWLEELIALLFLLFMLTQVALPLVLGRPLFPLRRWWRRAHELAEAQDAIDAARVEAEVDALRQRAKMISQKEE